MTVLLQNHFYIGIPLPLLGSPISPLYPFYITMVTTYKVEKQWIITQSEWALATC